ncbi:phage terminase small subunit [Alloscardovia omnicolens]|uniref:Uncharacterized protein n=1 Tax=Alloscardovia omnicolens TaxID=419015 RepID=A0A2I1M1I7_9BIFI|nr:hypothetical protein [Alloscardovia omnicolens]MDK6664343.1 hypothetical protein [Alloscardovia omnicolens]MDK7748701.1 hypothetical protein [Alloscardovia omnicolens]MDU3532125.1 hypothetical protein [Alloscardovia omnicolens]PKZ14003.1 hypothetical protein CYJ32_07640 [Alloscardovia omnicolens]
MAGNNRRAAGSSGGVLKAPDRPLGPELPDASQILPKNHEWLPIVQHWYDEFRVSPQAQLVRTSPMWMSLQLAFVQINEMLLTGRFATMSPEVRQLMGQFGWTPASLRAMKLDKPLADDYAAGVGDGEHGKPRGNDMEEFKRRSRIAGRQRVA